MASHEEFKKWQVAKYYKNNKYFWLITFVILMGVCSALDNWSFFGVGVGFFTTVFLVFLYSMLVGVHPEEKE